MRKDAPTVQYLKDNNIFADVFNYYMYNGEQVIKPDMLHEKDPKEITLLQGKNGKQISDTKYRDLLKYVTAKSVGNIAYFILGIEAQDKMHFVMPVRNMLYDSKNYDNQVESIAKRHKQNIEDKTERSTDVSSDEYLSGFYSTDKLTPVITLVIYFGSEKWTAPTTIHEMLDIDDPKILQYVPDYKINLITPESIPEEDFDKFQTEIRQVLKLIKHSKDKDCISRAVHDNEYEDVSKDTVNLLSAVLGINFKFDKRKERVNMCKAFEDLLEDAKAEGRAEAISEAIDEERKKSSKAIENIAIKSLKANIPSETVAQITNLPLEEILRLAEELKTSEAK